MPNTYTQLHVQFVFAVKFRNALIAKEWKNELHKYITGIFQNHHHKTLAINSIPDHIYILAGIRPHQSISSLVQVVKAESTKWIKEKYFLNYPFAWQEGYGAFSYSKSHVSALCNYIEQQKIHHLKQNFLQEYMKFLEVFEIEYEERFVFVEPA